MEFDDFAFDKDTKSTTGMSERQKNTNILCRRSKNVADVIDYYK